MAEPLRVEVTSFSSAATEQRAQGLLGWLCVVINGSLQLDAIAVRRTRAGELTLAFPQRRDSAGRRHPYIRPLSTEVRRGIERQVFKTLGLAKEEPR